MYYLEIGIASTLIFPILWDPLTMYTDKLFTTGPINQVYYFSSTLQARFHGTQTFVNCSLDLRSR